jgi:hypothetical protein
MMQVRSKLAMFVIVIGTAASLIAGGFVLDIGKPLANPEAQAINAALVVRAMACVEQDKTTVTGTAEGIVNGARRSIPLQLTPISEKGVFAVRQQWPDKGEWVLTFVAENPRMGYRGAIVRLDGGRVDWETISRFNQAPTKHDVEAALHTVAVASR